MQEKTVAKFSLEDGREIIFRYPEMGDAQSMLDYINTLSKEKTFIRFQGEQLSLEYEKERLTGLLKKIENKMAIFSDNPIAQKMYKSFGFKKLGSLPEGIMHKDHFDDHIYMFKKI